MPDSRASRFAFEVLFLVALAIAVVLADLRPLLIAGVMLVGWVIVALLEWAAWRDEPHYASGLPPRYYVPQVSLPPRQPLEQVARYPSAEQRDEAPTWIASAALRAEVLGAWPVAPVPAGEETQAEEPPDALAEDEAAAVDEPEPVPELAAEHEPEVEPEPEPEPVVAAAPADEGAEAPEVAKSSEPDLEAVGPEPEPVPEPAAEAEPEPEPVVAAAPADDGAQAVEGANGSEPDLDAVAPAEIAAVDAVAEPDEIAAEDDGASAEAVPPPRRRRFWHRRREPAEETDAVSALPDESGLEPVPAATGAVEAEDTETGVEPVPEPEPEPELALAPEPEPERQGAAEPEPVLELVAAAPRRARHRLDPLAEPEARRWPWQRRSADDHSVAEVSARPTGPRVLPRGSRPHDG